MKRKHKLMQCLVLMAAGVALPTPAQTVDAVGTSTAVRDPAAAMSEGEVRTVDHVAKKVTLRHGEIENLGMPRMTMVFHVKDAAMLDALKQGDKVRFRADRAKGVIVVTEIRPAR
jgi:Cu/Ag efflux protein CusF